VKGGSKLPDQGEEVSGGNLDCEAENGGLLRGTGGRERDQAGRTGDEKMGYYSD